MSKNFNICYPKCSSKYLYKSGKDKARKQKYLCKTCHKQFTKDFSVKQKLNYLKCPIDDTVTYLHHDYEHYSRFKYNSKKCNHIILRNLFFMNLWIRKLTLNLILNN